MLKVFYDDLNVLKVETDEKISSISFGDIIDYDDTGYTVQIMPLDLSKKLTITINKNVYEIIPRGITHKSWFFNHFDATNERLGSYVENGMTYFKVYAPTRYSVTLVLDGKLYKMSRKDNGVYWIKFNKNLHGAIYTYLVNEEIETTDPYAKASLPNRGGSVVVDFDKLNLEVNELETSADPIILEAHVRDFSMDPEVPFKYRGKFLGMLESHGNYGMNHILDLGISHVQLMPVNDFETVNELNQFEKYNWGYDPMQFMVLEGSYSSNVHNPFQVLYDFARLVDGYHTAQIGINLDVVFNHVYDVQSHPFNILVPYYYFRYDESYNLSNGSFCGNELASERPMVRKLILDTIDYFIDVFKIDGFRFDLMGLLDIETMNQVSKRNALIYGEGWRMPTVLEDSKQAHMFNANKMPKILHFNDKFRDTIAGPLNDPEVGFGSGMVKNEIVSVIEGRTVLEEKSINYIECHDNLTLADKVRSKEIAKFLTAVTILSKGTPLIQIGQSFFRDKKGDANSYKSSDEINMIRWSLLDKHSDFNDFIKKTIKWRKALSYERLVIDQVGNSIFIGDGDKCYKIDGDKCYKIDGDNLTISEYVF